MNSWMMDPTRGEVGNEFVQRTTFQVWSQTLITKCIDSWCIDVSTTRRGSLTVKEVPKLQRNPTTDINNECCCCLQLEFCYTRLSFTMFSRFLIPQSRLSSLCILIICTTVCKTRFSNVSWEEIWLLRSILECLKHTESRQSQQTECYLLLIIPELGFRNVSKLIESRSVFRHC